MDVEYLIRVITRRLNDLDVLVVNLETNGFFPQINIAMAEDHSGGENVAASALSVPMATEAIIAEIV